MTVNVVGRRPARGRDMPLVTDLKRAAAIGLVVTIGAYLFACWLAVDYLRSIGFKRRPIAEILRGSPSRSERH